MIRFKLLLASGAEVNASVENGKDYPALNSSNAGGKCWRMANDPPGATPLHIAAAKGLTDIVELLLSHGADVNAKANGWTPLKAAIENNHPDVAKLLRKHHGRL